MAGAPSPPPLRTVVYSSTLIDSRKLALEREGPKLCRFSVYSLFLLVIMIQRPMADISYLRRGQGGHVWENSCCFSLPDSDKVK